jgi:hypothetical protein
MADGELVTVEMLRNSAKERATLRKFVIPFPGMYSATLAEDTSQHIDNQDIPKKQVPQTVSQK